jgi:hypothetical protein
MGCSVVETAYLSIGMIAVTKFQLVLTSLVAVIPGAFLIFVLVTAMLQYSDKMSTTAYIVVGGTLLSMVITVLMPLGILVGGGRKSSPSKAAAPGKSSGEPETLGDSLEVVDESSEAFTLDDESMVSSSDDSMEASMSDSMESSFDDASQSEMNIHTSEFDLSESFDGVGVLDDESVVDTDPVEDFDDSLELDDPFDEVEEEPKPKKKKR